MKLAITGGAGFIGHHLAPRLSYSGHDVVCVDNLSTSSEGAVEAIRSRGIPLIKADVRDYDDIVGAIEECDAVVHSAALVDVEESVRKPTLYLQNNTVGTATVAKACADLGVERVVYLSSAAVYGDPVELPIDEEHPLRPLSPYGLSKFAGEQVIRLYSSLYGLHYVTLRIFNAYGSGQRGGVVAEFVSRVKRGLPLIIHGDGTQTRDFIHVRDICAAVEKALETKNVNRGCNVGSGRATEIERLAELVARVAELEPNFERAPSRPGDVRQSCADISKATKFLGFTPSVCLEEGLRELLVGV